MYTVLKDVATENMADIVMTCPVFHRDTSTLKAVAPWNMDCMVVTCPVFH